METRSSNNHTYWTDTAQVTSHRSLQADRSADVCVVGAGIAGLTTAYLLQRAGKSTVVLEDRTIGGGQTHRTTAHLSNEIDDRYTEIERYHGREGARLAAESHTAAIDRIEQIVQEEQIDCDFERLDGYLFLAPGQPQQWLEEEYEAALRTQIVDVKRIERAPLSGFDTGPCLKFARQAQFHPLKYLNGLAEAFVKAGGELYTHTHVTRIQGGSRASAHTSGGAVVHAGAIVVATNTPINDRVTMHTKQAPYQTYVIGARVPRGSVPRALYWDTLDPYHYVRLQSAASAAAGSGDAGQTEPAQQAEYDLLIVGGEDHKTGQAHDGTERYRRLDQWARERFPMMEPVEICWSGMVMEPVDGIAFIGRNPMDSDNIYIATGDSGMGMTHGTIAGILLTDLITGRQNPWARLYDPSRKSLRSLGEFAKENLNVAGQYLSWLTPGEVNSADQIAPGQGAVLRKGMRKVAVYRAPEGELIELSAVCPHLGCLVSWNESLSTWDCPCHGSRFAPDGTLVNGPSNANLTCLNRTMSESEPKVHA